MSEQFNRIVTALDICPEELVQVLATNCRTVHLGRIDELEALVDRLESSFKTREGAQAWLRSECGYFGGLRPIDALLSGRVDRVDAALEALDAGVFA